MDVIKSAILYGIQRFAARPYSQLGRGIRYSIFLSNIGLIVYVVSTRMSFSDRQYGLRYIGDWGIAG